MSVVAAIVIAALIVGGTYGIVRAISAAIEARARARAARAPSAELARAMRWIDRTLAYDDAVPGLSTALRDEGRTLLNTYYKELS